MAKAPRFELLDTARGAAIVAMIGYHLLWDLTLYGLVPIEIILSPALRAVQLIILGSFLLISGASLELSVRDGVSWQKFWRRVAIIAAAALIISAATLWAFPETFVFFGVLHALALFSVVGVLLRKLPTLALALVASIVIAAPILWTDPTFMDRRLAWIGFYPESPPTNDLVPIFPWLGVFLAGFVGMRLIRTLPAWRGGVLGWMGRWSLIIYLAHQPLLLGIVYTLSLLFPAPQQFGPDAAATQFVGSCEASCGESNTITYCQRYCGCALNAVIENNLWDELSATDPGEAMGSVTATCAALASEL